MPPIKSTAWNRARKTRRACAFIVQSLKTETLTSQLFGSLSKPHKQVRPGAGPAGEDMQLAPRSKPLLKKLRRQSAVPAPSGLLLEGFSSPGLGCLCRCVGVWLWSFGLGNLMHWASRLNFKLLIRVKRSCLVFFSTSGCTKSVPMLG